MSIPTGRPSRRPVLHDVGFGERMRVALAHLSGIERGRVSQMDVAVRAAALLGIEPMTSAAVSRHFNGRIPILALVGAYAAVMRVDPGWLGFGTTSAAPAPPAWGMATRAVSVAQLDADVAEVESLTPPAKGRRKPRAG